MYQEHSVVEAGHWLDKANKRFIRNIFLRECLFDKFIDKCNNIGVFKTAYSYTRKNQNESTLLGDMYFDFDDEDNFETVREDAISTVSYLKIVFKIMPDDLDIYYSGNKGIHIIVKKEILGVEPNKYLNLAFKHMAETANKYSPNKTVDLQIYDNKRLFRVPNTIHESSGLYKRLISYDQLRYLDEEGIKELAKAPFIPEDKKVLENFHAKKRFQDIIEKHAKEVVYKNIKSNGNLKYTPPCIEIILKDGANKNGRNNCIAVLASFYKSKGEDLNSTISLTSKWNSEKNSPPTSQNELVKTVRSIFLGKSSYGCTFIKGLGFCEDNNKCKFKKKR